MKRLFPIFILYIGIFYSVNMEKVNMKDLIPYEIHGWKAKGEDIIYNPQNIFDYINGAGEVYRSYNFRELLVRRFFKQGNPEIIVDLFDMGSSEDAFGIFTHDREGNDIGIGQGSEYRSGLLSFWKDRYFISILTEQETEASKQALLSLGRSISNSIKSTGFEPELLKLLPSNGLINNSIKYFHNHNILNYHYFLSDKNILNLNQETRVVLAEYLREKGGSLLLLVQYPDEKKAKSGLNNFLKLYFPESKIFEYFQNENNKWIGAINYNDLIIIVLDASSKSLAEELIKSVRNNFYIKNLSSKGDPR
ncbi:MAG: DUF6599 family protein [Acidobacteriota bacterium]